MIKRFNLIRNIGQFDSVHDGAQLELDRLALVYAENGRGKTTISAILRSLQSGSAATILERTRLGSTHPPHVVIEMGNAPSPTVFQNGAWSRAVPEVVIYDDVFVDENVYSGLSVDANHRQNLNEVILGSQGVALNRELQQRVQRIEAHNHDLRVRAEAIPAAERGALSVDDFCALPMQADMQDALNDSTHALAAVIESETIKRTELLEEIAIPAIDLASIQATCERSLEAIDSAAAMRVEEQLRRLGAGSAPWLAEGSAKIHDDQHGRPCPFCTQSTATIELVDSYRAYFSSEYSQLKSDISTAQATIETVHALPARDRVAAAMATLIERRQYWARFADLPEIDFDAPDAVADWADAARQAHEVLDVKSRSPLERIRLPERLLAAAARLEEVRNRVATLNDVIAEMNRSIAIVKERAAAGNAAAIEADIRRLRMIGARYSEPMATACQDYQDEKQAKTQTEALRDQARTALDVYRTATFPAYETSINLYLQRLSAEFRVGSVTSTTNRGGASCTYNVIVNQLPVAVGSNQAGAPSFRNVLSAGDRNTLALAVFFAALDRDPALATRIVLVDDPMTSLDEHRLLVTAQELRRTARRAAQVIVLSHDKPFLFRVWEGADRTSRSALSIVRCAQGSTFQAWDVTAETITEHDRRHAAMRTYIETNTGNARSIAEGLRPILEVYLRAAYPDSFGPGALLGQFIDRVRPLSGTPIEILSGADVSELQDLKEYANRFHHDTNAAFQTEIINEGELVAFARRVHAFTRRP
jgi:wobble nucleotide-excising tRNase